MTPARSPALDAPVGSFLRTRTRLAAWALVCAGVFVEAPASWGQDNRWDGKAPMPTARLGLAACAVNGKVYAIGGYAQANASGLTTVEEYDPVSDSWRQRAEMPTGRRWLTVTEVSGKCYAIGGQTGPAAPGLNTVEEYDPAEDLWTSRAGMPSGRVAHAAAAANGKIFVVGGGTSSSNLVSTSAVYDPSTNTWETAADMPTIRGTFPAAGSVNGKIYVLGGSGGPRDVDEYDPATDSWARKASMITGTQTLAASVVDQRIYAIGGKSVSSDTPLRTLQEYDATQDAWSGRLGMENARWGLASAVVGAKIYALGGSETHPPPHPGLATNEEYSPPRTAPKTVRRCFFDAETRAPISEVRVTPQKGPSLLLGSDACSDEVPNEFLTIEAPGYRRRDTHAVNGKLEQGRASLPGENGLYFGLFPRDSAFTEIVDAGRTTGKKKKRGVLQGLPGLKFEIVRSSDFPMSMSEIKRGVKKELRKRGKFAKPTLSVGDSLTMEQQILLRHEPGAEPSVECSILEDGVCWGPIVSFDAAAGDSRSSLEQGLRMVFYRGAPLATGSEAKSFYRGFQATVVGQRLRRGKEVDVVPGSVR